MSSIKKTKKLYFQERISKMLRQNLFSVEKGSSEVRNSLNSTQITTEKETKRKLLGKEEHQKIHHHPF
jgi:hypothetical protein